MRLAKRSPWLTTAALLLLGAIVCGALAFLTPLTASVGAANGGFTESLDSEEVVLDFVTTTSTTNPPTTTSISTTTSCTNVKGVNTCSGKLTTTTNTITTTSTSCTNVKGVNICSPKQTTTITTTTGSTTTP